MAIYVRGKKVQSDGFKPLAVNQGPVNASPINLKVVQNFCLYRVNNGYLELLGACVLENITIEPTSISTDILNLPGFLKGNYAIDETKSETSVITETSINNTDRNGVIALVNNALKLTIGSSHFNLLGGSALYHLYLIRK